MDAPNATGEMQSWEVELHSRPTLTRMGLNQQNLKAGDRITVFAWPNRVPENPLVFGIGLITEDGTRIGQHSLPEHIESEFTDAVGVERIQGRWQVVLSGPPMGDKTPLPLTEAGELAVADYDPKTSPANTCEIVNIPTAFHIPYLFDIRIDNSEVVITYEIFNIVRRIPFSDTAVQSEVTGMMGVSRAYVEGAELVIESSGYPPSKWGLAQAGDANGIGVDVPSSAKKAMVERYSVSEDGMQINIAYELQDAVYLSQTYTNTTSAFRVSDDYPIYEYNCEVDSAARFSR